MAPARARGHVCVRCRDVEAPAVPVEPVGCSGATNRSTWDDVLASGHLGSTLGMATMSTAGDSAGLLREYA